MALPEGTRLHFGGHEGHAVVKITGVRAARKRVAEPRGLSFIGLFAPKTQYLKYVSPLLA